MALYVCLYVTQTCFIFLSKYSHTLWEGGGWQEVEFDFSKVVGLLNVRSLFKVCSEQLNRSSRDLFESGIYTCPKTFSFTKCPGYKHKYKCMYSTSHIACTCTCSYTCTYHDYTMYMHIPCCMYMCMHMYMSCLYSVCTCMFMVSKLRMYIDKARI